MIVSDLTLKISLVSIIILLGLPFGLLNWVPVAASVSYDPLALACNFLVHRYNSTLGLLSETADAPKNHTYNVASDNLLASYAMIRYCQASAASIGNAIKTNIISNPCCNHGNDSLHEVLLGTRIGLPVHDIQGGSSSNHNVTRYWPRGDYVVQYGNFNDTGILHSTDYGDVAAYTVLERQLEHNATGVLQEMNNLKIKFNGLGINDTVFTGPGGEHGFYQTYKSALYILALWNTTMSYPSSLESRILSMQDPILGGFHTHYDANGNYGTSHENVETTSIVIIALSSIPRRFLNLVSMTCTITGAGTLQIHDSQYCNMTGNGTNRTITVNLTFTSGENWTRDFDIRVYWDTTLLGDQTLKSVPPNGTLTSGVSFSRSVLFDPCVTHRIMIQWGNSGKDFQVYPSTPTCVPCSSWQCYWYVLLIPITGITLTFLYLLYYRPRRREAQTQKPSILNLY